MNKRILISIFIFFTICSRSWAEAELIANCEGAYGQAIADDEVNNFINGCKELLIGVIGLSRVPLIYS